MEISNADVLNLLNVFNDMGDMKGSNSFKLSVIKNKRELEGHLEDYQKRLQELVQENDENVEDIENGIENCSLDFQREVNDLLQSTFEADLQTIDVDDVPEELTLSQMETLELILDT